MVNGLEARLEAVEFVGFDKEAQRTTVRLRDLYKYNKEFYVFNTPCYFKTFLARFDSCFLLSKGEPTANFVASYIPHDFRGLNPDEYLLYGMWIHKWKFAGEYPSLQEIASRFNPGQMNKIFYFKQNFGERKGKAVITAKEFIPINRSIREILKTLLPNPFVYSRVVIVESKSDVSSVKKQAERLNLAPIKMRSLRW